MSCTYGSRKKESQAGTIEIDLYSGLNTAAVVVLIAYGAPRTVTVSLDGLCSSDPPEVQDIHPDDVLLPPILINKLINNKTVQAWYANCECKPKPEQPPSPPPYDPPDNVTCPSPLNYPDDVPFGWSIDIIWEGNVLFERVCLRELISYNDFFTRKDNITVQIMSHPARVVILRRGEYFSSFMAGDMTEYHYAVAWYKPFGDERDDDDDDDDNDEPDYPDFPSICDCVCEPTDLSAITAVLGEILLIVQMLLDSGALSYADFRYGLAEINLHTSESNTRIRDDLEVILKRELLASINPIALQIADFKTAMITEFDKNTTNLQLFHDTTENNASSRKGEIISQVQASGNGILAAIAAALAAILAAILASTTAITTELATAVGTITASIGAATTTITSHVTIAIQTLGRYLERKFDDVEKKVDDKFEEYHPKRLYVLINITKMPSNISGTAGTGGAPDKYAFGWVLFFAKAENVPNFYYERQFITTEKSIFRCPQYGEDTDCVIHLIKGCTAVSSKVYQVEKNGS
jgi:hypothetical protein